MGHTTKAIVSGVVAGALIAGAILWFNVPFGDSRVPPAKKAVIEPTTKPADGLLYARTGVDAQNKGDFDQAIELYSQAIESGDLPREGLARVYNNRGAAFKNTDFYDLAIEDYNAAIRLKKDYARAYYNRAIAYHVKGRPELAIKDYGSAIRLKPDNASAYNNRALAHEKIGQYDLAVDDLSQAIRLVPSLDYAYFNRGRVYQIKGDLEHAIKDFKKSYALNPDNRDYQAKVEELGLLEKALQVVRTASSPDKMAPATERAPAEPSEALTTTPPERALPPATKDTGTKPSEAPTAESSDGASPPSTDQTDTQLSRLSTPDSSMDATTRSGMEILTEGDGNLVFLIQSRLKEKGLDPGPLDGLMGPRTRAAIKAYQGKYGLIADGKPTRSLLDHLEQELLGQSSKGVGG